MKLKFETAFRFYLIALITLLVWSVWNTAAQTQNDMAAAATAQAAGTNVVATVNHPLHVMETPDWIDHLAESFPFLKRTLWGNELWKYLFSLVYIFLAFYVSKFLDFATRVWLKKLAAKTETKLDDLLLELLNGPIKVVAFIIFLRVGLDVFSWPDTVQKFLSKGFTVVVAISLTYMVLKFIDLMLGYWRRHARVEEDPQFDQQLFPIIRKSLKLFVLVVAALVTSQNLGINITAALASLSIGGLAVGLAAQDTLANLFGAVAVFADKPFRIGDTIKLDVGTGAVESIGMRSTRVRNSDGHVITIPNKIMGNAAITNISSRPTIRTEMNIGLMNDTPADKVRRALALVEEIYRTNPKTAELTVNFNKFADAFLNIQVVYVWKGTDNQAYLADMQEMNLKLKERFDAEGIRGRVPLKSASSASDQRRYPDD